jgi:hypothetical protein
MPCARACSTASRAAGTIASSSATWTMPIGSRSIGTASGASSTSSRYVDRVSRAIGTAAG